MNNFICFTCRNNNFVEQKVRQLLLFIFLFFTIVVLSGCRVTTQIDPTGEYFFRDASSAPVRTCPPPSNNACSTCQSCPEPQRNPTTWLGSSRDPNSTIPKNTKPLLSSSRDITELILGPTDPVARVGTYVVMVAGVKDRGGNYRKNKQIEWTIDCSSPGGFIDVDRRDWCDIFVGEWDPPRIESPQHAFTSTSRKPLRLTKGTPTPLDDVIIHEGQTWTAISSPCEGTTKLTAVALDSNDWQSRLRAANIHWIDAWPVLPPSKIAQNYSQPLKLQSSVFRSNGSAALGCIAVYEILDGAEDVEFTVNSENAGSEKITQIVVPVGNNGIAEAQLVKKSPSAGQTKIRTTLIRDNVDGKFTVPIRLAQGETIIEWGEAGLLISQSGPAIVSGGMEAAYRITVRNVNSEKLNEIVVTNTTPESFEYQRSMPVGRVLDAFVTNSDGTKSQKIQWTVPGLDPGQYQTFDVFYRPQKDGDYSLVSTAQSGSALAEDVFKTRILSSSGALSQTPAPSATPTPLPGNNAAINAELDIQIVCQDTAAVGNSIVVHVYIKNIGSETLMNLIPSISHSQGLCSSFGANPVHLRPIASIEPGYLHNFSLQFTANSPGRQTINLELTAQNGQRFNRQAFITVEGNACQTNNDNSIYPTTTDNTQNPGANSILDSDNSTTTSNYNIDKDLISLNVTAPAEAKAGEEFQIDLQINNNSDKELSNARLTCFLDSSLELIRNTEGFVTNNPYNPYLDLQTPVLPKNSTHIVLVVKGKKEMPVICSFVVQQGNSNLVNKDCQIIITKNDNVNLAPQPIAPDTNGLDPIAPIPDVNVPDPDSNLNSETPIQPLDEQVQIPIQPSDVQEPITEDPNLGTLDDLSLESPPLLDVPDPVNDPQLNSNDKINVNISIKRSKITTNQTFTCQIELKNNASVPMNNVEFSFYFPADSFKLVKLGTTGQTQYNYNALNGSVTFKPFVTLEPGNTLNYNIRLLPQKNGTTELSAMITAKESGITDVQQNAKITVNVE